MSETYSLTDTTRGTELIAGSGQGAWDLARHLHESGPEGAAVALIMEAEYHGHETLAPETRVFSSAEVQADTARLFDILSALNPDQVFGSAKASDWAQWCAAVNKYAADNPDSVFRSAFHA